LSRLARALPAPAGARAHSSAAPIANRERQKSTGGGRKCSQLFPVEHTRAGCTIKTLAKYLGFTWRDSHPSGAASVEWFDRWCRERKPEIRQRILDYNEDDCRATRVLLDGIRSLAA
jgi:hypothetical protein